MHHVPGDVTVRPSGRGAASARAHRRRALHPHAISPSVPSAAGSAASATARSASAPARILTAHSRELPMSSDSSNARTARARPSRSKPQTWLGSRRPARHFAQVARIGHRRRPRAQARRARDNRSMRRTAHASRDRAVDEPVRCDVYCLWNGHVFHRAHREQLEPCPPRTKLTRIFSSRATFSSREAGMTFFRCTSLVAARREGGRPRQCPCPSFPRLMRQPGRVPTSRRARNSRTWKPSLHSRCS